MEQKRILQDDTRTISATILINFSTTRFEYICSDPYLCPGDGVLQSRELGNQLSRLVLLTDCSILQIE